MKLLPYKKTMACRFGPGGLHCTCCNPYGSTKNAKKVANRYFRRNAKLELVK